MNTDKVYAVYEKWYAEKYPNGGAHYEDAILEFAAELFEKLEAAQNAVCTCIYDENGMRTADKDCPVPSHSKFGNSGPAAER